MFINFFTRAVCILLWICCSFQVAAQEALVQGKITEINGVPIESVAILVTGTSNGTVSDSTGFYSLKVPAEKPLTFVFQHIGYQSKRIEILLTAQETRRLDVILEKTTRELSEVEIKASRGITLKPEISLSKIDPQTVKVLPSAFGDFNKILATLPGVVSNNELSSAYSVRGGNFDENLVYVNLIEVYRPFLVRAGQQEGLSFINPDLIRNIEFSSGGWQAKYGDKLSSVLNIAYKEPTQHAGSVTVGLLGGAGHLEGVALNKRISYIAGIRQKRSQYLLGTLDVKGEYLPRFTDFQSYISVDLSRKKSSSHSQTESDASTISSYPKSNLGILLSYARNRYLIQPVNRETSFGTFDQVLKLFVAFDGQEVLNYDMYQGGVRLTHQPHAKLTTHLIVSGMKTSEREYMDVEGAYRLCDIDVTPGSNRFNECIGIVGIGSLYNHSRNRLQARLITFENRNVYQPAIRSTFEWGVKYGKEIIDDILQEYAYTDSAEYININEALYTSINLNTDRFSGYLQHSYLLTPQQVLTYGFRVGYWSLNKQLLLSPSVQYSYKPAWEKEVIFKLAAGIYRQPPFYRELRNRQGEINENLKAQSSLHIIAGAERILKLWDRDFLFTSEAYYKRICDAVAYDVENVRIRYFANNNTDAYAYGLDMRLSGEFIKGAESWFSLGILNTRENLGIEGQGYIRRPTDQRLTFAAYFQDHIPNNPTLRVNLNLVFGTGLPFGPPQTIQYRSVFTAPWYRRVDIGFSKIVDFSNKKEGIGKFTKSLWLGAEILNVLGARNTISYSWITDINRRQYAVPNTLSARFLNIKLIANF